MGKRSRPILAICYDFDGTLAPGNMQEYDFFPQLNIKPADFWRQAARWAKEQEADKIIAYMCLMLKKAKASDDVCIKRDDFVKYGKTVELYKGVERWFKRINSYARTKGIVVEHYIISSGIREMIEGTSIAEEFQKIYASSFMYDQHQVAVWPGLAINYTTKTQFLFRINKGIFSSSDDRKINKYVAKEKRRIPFTRMIYIGDGSTDVPCMKLVKEQGGHSIAVYKPWSPSKAQAKKLLEENRVDFVAPADYSANKLLDKLAKRIIDKISADVNLVE